MALQFLNFASNERPRRRARGESATFVVPSASGAAVPVSERIDLKDVGEVLSDRRLAEVAAARLEAHVAQSTQA